MRSGIRTRQQRYFYARARLHFNGREGDGYKTRKGKKSTRLRTSY